MKDGSYYFQRGLYNSNDEYQGPMGVYKSSFLVSEDCKMVIDLDQDKKFYMKSDGCQAQAIQLDNTGLIKPKETSDKIQMYWIADFISYFAV